MSSLQLEVGSLLTDRYRIESVIGRGGMGTVYLGKHLHLDSVVAIKEVRAQFATEEEKKEALQQCEAEARFLVQLHHPNLPRVTDAFVADDRCYVIMEFIQGQTLDKRLRDAGAPLDALEVVEWALQIADVLSYLHSQTPPIIFRDLKPANIMVQPDNTIRLIDFGIARRFQPGAQKDTALFGSVGYSPPEQFGLRQTDPRADIYALGATLHHLLTARDPAAEPFQFPPVGELNPRVPVSLARLVGSCVAMDPEHRPQTVHDVAAKLMAIHAELIELKEQEAQSGRGKRRSGKLSQRSATGGDGNRRPGPSGDTTKRTTKPLPARPSKALIALVAALALIALLLAAAAMLRGSHAHSPPSPGSDRATPKTGQVNTVTTADDTGSGPAAGAGQNAATTAVTGAIQLADPPQDLADSVLAHVRCEVRGLAGEEAKIEVRLLDADDDSQPPRILLRGGQKLSVQYDDESFDPTLRVSKSGMNASPRSGLKLQCVLLGPGGDQIAATDIIPLANAENGSGSAPGESQPGSPQSPAPGAQQPPAGAQAPETTPAPSGDNSQSAQ
jgi:serine/threonine protein kinase